MLTKIRIQNLLSYKDMVLDLASGVNVLVGLTGAGKSAIMWALYWIIKGRPTGDVLRSHWGGETLVELTIDGHKVGRIKSNTQNAYYIDDSIFNAVGTDVPEEVQSLLNMSDVNIHMQLDPHFLLSASPPEVARQFNKAAHLDRIDIGLQNIQQWMRKIRQNMASGTTYLKEMETELERYSNFDELDGRLTVIENLEQARNKLGMKCHALRALKAELDSIRVGRRRFEQYIALEQDVSGLLKMYEKKKGLDERIYELGRIRDELQSIGQGKQEAQRMLSLQPLLQSIEKLCEKREHLKRKIQPLKKLTLELPRVQEAIGTVRKELAKLQQHYNKIFPDICPFCGSRRGGCDHDV